MKLIEKVRDTANRLKAMGRRPSRKHPPQKLQARVRAAVASAADPYDDDEPQTKLTSAFVVVLILHVVAVGGIYAFNQIKASRRSLDGGSSAATQGSTKSASATDRVEPAVAQPPAPAVASPSPAFTSTLSGSRRPGQVLNATNAKPKAVTEAVPVKKTDAGEAKSTPATYTVKSGDRLIFIAKKFSVSQEDLMAFNKISDPNKLQVGQSLKIPKKK